MEVKEMSYLFAAYTIILVTIFAYILLMFYKQRQVRVKVDSLQKALEAREED